MDSIKAITKGIKYEKISLNEKNATRTIAI
jgi:hypothetical protein